MFYENDLQFLCDTLRKSRLHASIVGIDEPIAHVIDNGLEHIFAGFAHKQISVREYVGKIEHKTIYKLTDAFKMCYLYMLLPGASQESLLFVGPFLSAPLSARQILEIGERRAVPPKHQKILEGYYSGLPVVPDNSHLYMMLDAFGERVWGNGSAFSFVDIDKERSTPPTPLNSASTTDEPTNELINMKIIEKRYEYENELINSVKLGQAHKAEFLLTALSAPSFEKRSADPLRNIKNYSIIMNTLLRKAAEEAGVHPIYIDRVSSSLAMKIEHLPSVADSGKLMSEIFKTYCNLVRKHSMKNYSPLVQKAIVFVESDLSANLTLSSLAEAQKVSPGYLSTVFKKETGKTVTEYIRDKRIKHAMHLLSTTHLQIQTVALHCGIMDVQYFTKLFKKHTGKTPKEYRDSVK